MSEYRTPRAERPLRGTVHVPTDKSISHRALILAALAEGETRIANLLHSETVRATARCLSALGVELEQAAPGRLTVHGRGLRSLKEPEEVLFCAGSGTTMRLLAGVCAGQAFLSILDGTPALKRRPMARVIEPLSRMGAQIIGREENTRPPLAIRGGGLHGITYDLPVASAQVKSAILLAGLFADSPTRVREPLVSRDHTERMLAAYGVDVQSVEAREVGLRPPERLIAPEAELRIPGDFSSAAFLIAAALLVPGSDILLPGLGLNPTRAGMLAALTRMGARCAVENSRTENSERVGDLHIQSEDALRAVEVRGAEVPAMIDEFPIFAVLATLAEGVTRVCDAAELRVKESDRIAGLVEELRKLGAQIEPQPDGFIVEGPTRLRGARVSAHGDHRLAMSLAVAGLVAEGETVVEGWESTADSFPTFGAVLTELVSR